MEQSAFDKLFEEPQRSPQTRTDYIGQRIGPYEIESQLVDGLYSQVWLARDVALNRKVALKVLKLGPWISSGIQQRFKTEGRILAQLKHPNIIRLYGLHEFQGAPCLALEFAEYGTLRSRLLGQPLPFRSVVTILIRISRAVGSAHEMGVVHRDLKPENVLFDSELNDPALETEFGTVKVADFGIAKLLDDFESQTLTGRNQPGTPDYMAPEQIEGEKSEIGPATDVHALGVMAFLMATGRHPFAGGSVAQVLDRILHETPRSPLKLNPQLPDWFDELCQCSLAKRPASRFRTAKEFAEVLEKHFVDMQEISSRTDDDVLDSAKTPSRNEATGSNSKSAKEAVPPGRERHPVDSISKRSSNPTVDYWLSPKSHVPLFWYLLVIGVVITCVLLKVVQ